MQILTFLQWNISDYFYQNREKIIKELDRDLSDKEKAKLNMAPFDALWMCLYSKLGILRLFLGGHPYKRTSLFTECALKDTYCVVIKMPFHVHFVQPVSVFRSHISSSESTLNANV